MTKSAISKYSGLFCLSLFASACGETQFASVTPLSATPAANADVAASDKGSDAVPSQSAKPSPSTTPDKEEPTESSLATCVITPADSVVNLGDSLTFKIAITGIADSVQISDSSQADLNISTAIKDLPPVSSDYSVKPSSASVYTINVTNDLGTTSCVAKLNVRNPQAPGCTLAAVPATIKLGEISELIMTVTGEAMEGNIKFVTAGAQPIVNNELRGLIEPLATQTYTGTVTGSGGSSTCVATLTVIPPAPACTMTVSKASVQSGNPVTVTMQVQGSARDVYFMGNPVTATGITQEITPTANSTFTGNVTGPGGSATCSASVVVTPPPAPTCTLSASNNDLQAGQTSLLTLATAGDVAGATFDNKAITLVNQQFNSLVAPIASTTYRASVTGPGGSSECSVDIKVTPPAPTCTILASSESIVLGDKVNLAFAVSGSATSAKFNGSDAALTGTQVQLTPSQSQVIEGSVIGPGGTNTCRVAINVTLPDAPTCVLTATPNSMTQGATSTLSLTSTGMVTAASLEGVAISLISGAYNSQVSPTTTTTYTAKVTGTGGTNECKTTLTVIPPAPTCTISASSSSVILGDSTTLTFTYSGVVNSATFLGATVSQNGSTSLVTPNISETYRGQVTGPGGSGSCERQITVTVKEIEPDYEGCALKANTGLTYYPTTCAANSVIPIINDGKGQTMTCCQLSSTGLFSLNQAELNVVRDNTCSADEILTGMDSGSGSNPVKVRCSKINTTYFKLGAPVASKLKTKGSSGLTSAIKTILGSYGVSDACVCPTNTVMIGGHRWTDNVCEEKCVEIIKKP